MVGFVSPFAIVLVGLRAVGASPAEAASGLLAVSVAMGVTTILLAGVAAVALAAPGGLIEAAAGIALVATLGAALRGAFASPSPGVAPGDHVAAAVTLLVTVSTVAGVGAAFWGPVLGLAVLGVLTWRRSTSTALPLRSAPSAPPSPTSSVPTSTERAPRLHETPPRA